MKQPLSVEDAVRARRAVKSYDAGHEIDDATLARLFELTVLAPSSFNVQHWRFVVVRDPERKMGLKKCAYGQPQVAAASAAIVVCGKLTGYEDAARIYAGAPPSVQESVVPRIVGMYTDNPTFQRDEAIRSASLAAMTLMLTAQSMGLATGPMIGFDAAAVARFVELPPELIPVMLVVLGRQEGELRPRMERLGLDEVVKLESFAGPGLDS